MALTATEEALVRQLLDQQAAILSLAGNEATITSKLGATKVSLSDLLAASSVGDTDLFLTRQGTTDKSVTGAVLRNTLQVFQQEGSGAIQRSAIVKLQESFSVDDFGTVADGVADDGAAFRKAILEKALQGGGLVIAPSPKYHIATTVIVPSNVELDLCGAEIIGPGVGAVTDLFQSGNLVAGVMTSNIGSANESSLVMNATVKNGRIFNCGKAFNLFNFIDNCKIENIKFYDCTYAVHSVRSWYSSYVNLFSRGSAAGATNAAFHFSDFVNAQRIESVFVEGRSGVGIGVYGGANGQKLLTCSAENCATGLAIANETGPIEIDTCYFENISGVAVDCNSGGGYKYSISFRNNWFAAVPVGIRTEKTGGARIYVDETNRFHNVAAPIDLDDQYYNYGEIKIAPAAIADNGLPSIPAGYTVTGKSRVEHENIIYDANSGLARVRTRVHGDTLIAFEHEGNPGTPKTGTVAFCSVSKTAGTTFSLNIDTKISYTQWASFIIYRLTVSDNSGTFELFGHIYGDQVKVGDATGKTVAVSNNGGFVRITIGQFTHPTELYGCTGIVRHV